LRKRFDAAFAAAVGLHQREGMSLPVSATSVDTALERPPVGGVATHVAEVLVERARALVGELRGRHDGKSVGP